MNERVLQREPGRTVVLEAGGRIVRKSFMADDVDQAYAEALREADHMVRFAEALDALPKAHCPRLINVVADGTEPCIRMERARGVPLQDALNAEVWSDKRLADVSAVLADALLIYVETFAEPYWDFILRNMFFDVADGSITFLDFGVPVLYTPVLDELAAFAPVEVSLGGLVASSVFEAARPKRLTRRREHRQAPALAQRVVERCVDDTTGVDEVARITYHRATTDGRPLRRAWYRTVGYVFAGGPRRLPR